MNSQSGRVLAICLDAFDWAYAERLMRAGKLQGLARLKQRSAEFSLEHGDRNRERLTGLTWAQFSSGHNPESRRLKSPIFFDQSTYECLQCNGGQPPFVAGLERRVVVFDVPYFDLQKSPNTEGVVGWGGHDPGIYLCSSPSPLADEIAKNFAPPVEEQLLHKSAYSSAWNSQTLADALVAQVRNRERIIRWLLSERMKKWQLALVCFSEGHDSIEHLYHGINDKHPLATHASAGAAEKGLEQVYEAISNAICCLHEAYPDATIVTFSMHGMAENDTDVPTFSLLPELIYRMFGKREGFHPQTRWFEDAAPTLKADEDWREAIEPCFTVRPPASLRSLCHRTLERMKRVGGSSPSVKSSIVRRESSLVECPMNVHSVPRFHEVDWMPAYKYRDHWAQMDAFALPAYFDGRVRINLKGREKNGRVDPADYESLVRRIGVEIEKCRDLKTGAPVVQEIEFPGISDPLSLHETQCDVSVFWRGLSFGFEHPKYGKIGPVPVRRTGGHSGGFGFLLAHGDAITPGDRGGASSFDVAPTILQLCGGDVPAEFAGTGRIDQLLPVESTCE